MNVNTSYQDSLFNIESEKLDEECGIFGVYNVRNASYECFLGLQNLQHRGQEACGIVSCESILNQKTGCYERKIYEVLGVGEVSEVFIKNRVGNSDGIHFESSLPGRIAMGHVRYSTSGKKQDGKNIQPVSGKFADGKDLVVAHNGNFIDLDDAKKTLEEAGIHCVTSMDTEIILHMILLSKEVGIIDKIRDALSKVRGAYSLLIMYDGMMIGIRDPHGVRPLVFGEIKKDKSYFLSSETCALDIVGAKCISTIQPGGIIVIKDDHYTMFELFSKKKSHKFCLFEYIYFLRPDSVNDGLSVYNLRKKMGAKLSEESSVEADIVVPVPDSGIPAALGYSEHSGIKFEMGIVRNHYIGRTFLKPSNESRNSDLHIKHNANKFVIDGKKVIVVDDSMVRGNTSRKIVKMLKDAGAKEVHMRIACPEIKFSCLYGIDTPDLKELISNEQGDVEKIREYLGLDSLSFLTLDGLYSAVKGDSYSHDHKSDLEFDVSGFCDACFTGKYFI